MKRNFIAATMYLFVFSIIFGLTLAQADSPLIADKSAIPSPEGSHIVKVLWSKEYDPEGMNELRASTGMRFSVFPLFPVVRDGLAMIVTAYGDEETHAQHFILKLDEDGSIQWQRALGSDSVDVMVAVPNGYVLFQPQGELQQYKRFDNHGKLVKFRDWHAPNTEHNVRMFVRGDVIERVWTECSETACTAWKQEMDVRELVATTKVDALFKTSLPKAPKGAVRTQPHLSVLHRAPQEWVVDASVSYTMEGGEEVRWRGWLYALDEHGGTKWSVEYSDPKGGAFVRRILPVADGYIIVGSTTHTVWRRKTPDKIPATLEGLQSVLNRPEPSAKYEYMGWLLYVNNKGQAQKHNLSKGGVAAEFMQHDSLVGRVGCGDNNACELGATNQQGEVLWKTVSPLNLGNWSTPAVIPDGPFVWLLGYGKEKLLAVARIRVENNR